MPSQRLPHETGEDLMPEPKAIVSPLLLQIKNLETGEVRFAASTRYEFPDIRDSDWTYTWREGNDSCDCNRACIFARAGGEDEPEDPLCGDSRYAIVACTIEDGTKVDVSEWNEGRKT